MLRTSETYPAPVEFSKNLAAPPLLYRPMPSPSLLNVTRTCGLHNYCGVSDPCRSTYDAPRYRAESIAPPPLAFYAQFVREYPGDAKVRQDLQIATKFAPYPYRIGSQSIITACDETLERVEADVSTSAPPEIIRIPNTYLYDSNSIWKCNHVSGSMYVSYAWI